jgi:hypothetical protein
VDYTGTLTRCKGQRPQSQHSLTSKHLPLNSLTGRLISRNAIFDRTSAPGLLIDLMPRERYPRRPKGSP